MLFLLLLKGRIMNVAPFVKKGLKETNILFLIVIKYYLCRTTLASLYIKRQWNDNEKF